MSKTYNQIAEIIQEEISTAHEIVGLLNGLQNLNAAMLEEVKNSLTIPFYR